MSRYGWVTLISILLAVCLTACQGGADASGENRAVSGSGSGNVNAAGDLGDRTQDAGDAGSAISADDNTNAGSTNDTGGATEGQGGNAAGSGSVAGSKASLPVQKDITYNFEQSDVTKQGELYQSKQGYSMYVLKDGFSVTENENRDTVSLKGNGVVQMTIERLDEGIDQQVIVDQAEQDLKKTYKDVQMDESLRNDKFFQNAIIWGGADTKTATSVFVFYSNGHLFRATIFAKAAYEESLLQLTAMMKTVYVPEASSE